MHAVVSAACSALVNPAAAAAAAVGATYHRSNLIRYFTSCTAPTSSSTCPGNPAWISAKATGGTPGLPENATTTSTDGAEETVFTVTTACSCRDVYYGVVNFGKYRLLDNSYCN
jgi:hypothetical protein